MVPLKNKKKTSAASKSTPKDVLSGMKRLKKGGKVDIMSEEVVSDKKIIEEKKDDNAAKESVIITPKIKKPCTWLKLDRLNPPIGSKPSLESCKQGKEVNVTTQVQASKDSKRKRNEKGRQSPIHEKQIDSRPQKKEKQIVSGKREEETKRDEESEKNIGGLIFMCNAKTKPDCFKYRVMGVPVSKKEVVMNIKPGLKIFLYDYDLKLMYGVFETSSTGGMKLEPAAFGGAFPAQVRFVVHKDCLPLPESVFKKAIKDSYDERTRKFNTELTMKQVKNLVGLFSPTPWLRQNRNSVEERFLNKSATQGKSIPLHHKNHLSDFHNSVPHQDPLFVTEQEYRKNGLPTGRPLLPTASGENGGQSWQPNKLDVELKQLLRNPDSTTADPAVQQREVNRADSCFLSEKEYRIYGLRGPHQASNSVPPMMAINTVVRDSHMDSYDPYDESTTSLVNRYLSMPIATAIPAEPYSLFGREPYTNDHLPRIIPTDGERASASYNLREQSIFNQRSYTLNASRFPSALNQGVGLQRETGMTSAPVSNHYSFAGPSLPQHR